MTTSRLVERLAPWFGLATLAAATATGLLVSVGSGVLVIAGGLIVVILVVGYMAIDSLLAEKVDLASVADLQQSELLDLEREKSAILQSIRDLENERDLGKISPEDFESLDGFFRKRAIGVMKKIDRDLSSWRKRAEVLVAERLQATADKPGRRAKAAKAAEGAPAAEPTVSGSDLRPEPLATETAAAPAAAPEAAALEATDATPSAARACHACQTVVDEDSNFCKKCGAQVTCTCGAALDADSNFCKKCGAKAVRHA